MSRSVKVTDPMYEQAEKIRETRDVSLKEAFAIMAREGGYDV